MKNYGIYILTALLATGKISAQNIAEIGKSDPLIITGSIGSRNTFYHASGGNGYASPFSSSIYTNLNISLYGISMPFSFYYSNDNYRFSYPQFSFNISPSYKGWTLHLGRRSIPFSSYVYNLPFNGIGLEYQRSKGVGLRFAAFYGELKKAVHAEPDHISVQSPAFKRTGWGLKVGVGNYKNFVDIYLFKAKDHLSSLDREWLDLITAQENIVVGLRGKVAAGKHLTLSANMATSIFSSDLNASVIDVEKAQKYNKLFKVRYSSLLRWAGDVAATTHWKYFTASVYYKRIQPDYTSLGVSYMNNNYHSLGVAAQTKLGVLSLAGNFSAQADNLSDQQQQTTKGYVYAANASLPIGQHIHLSASYNGYLQRQFDGLVHLNDSSRIHRLMNSLSLNGGYDLTTERAGHSISLTGNYSGNKDKNPSAKGQSDVDTWAAGASYGIAVIPIETNFGVNYSHQSSNGYHSQYTTDIYALNVSKALLKNKKLQCSASFSFIQNKMDKETNFSLGGNVAMSYTLLDAHHFSFSLNYNRFTQNNLVAEAYRQKTKSYDLNCSLNYMFSFTALSIRRREKKEQLKAQERARKYEIYSDFTRSAWRERKLKAVQQQKDRENREQGIKQVDF